MIRKAYGDANRSDSMFSFPFPFLQFVDFISNSVVESSQSLTVVWHRSAYVEEAFELVQRGIIRRSYF